MSRLGFIAAALLLAGCATEPPPSRPSADSGVPSPAPEPAAPQPETPVERMRGVYSKTAGWMLCGASSAVPVAMPAEIKAEIDAFAPGSDAFFLDAWGHRTPEGLSLASIERMHTEGPDCREPLQGFVWVAHGQAPFWAFGITTSGIRFKPEGQMARNYAYSPPQTAGAQVVYSGPAYELRLTKRACHGAQGRARYAWQAELLAEGRSWYGCAWQGMQSEAAVVH